MTLAKRRSREDVVRAAGRLFSERGYHGTSMRDLGEDLGILGSSLYAHIGAKEELLVEVIERGAEMFKGLVEEVMAGEGSPSAKLGRLVTGHIGIVTRHLHEASVFLNEARFLSPERHSRVVEMRDRYQDAYRRVLAEGVVSGDFRRDLDVHLATIAVLSLINSLARWYRADGPKSPEELAEGLYDLITRGIT